MRNFLNKTRSLRIKIIASAALVGMAFLGSATGAYAFTAPTTGDMWYDFYDIFFNKLLQGPLGATITGGTLGWGLMSAVRGSLPQFAICTCAAGVMYNLDSVVNTFGFVA